MIWLHETSLLQAKAKKKETAACKADLTDGFDLEGRSATVSVARTSSVQLSLHKRTRNMTSLSKTLTLE